MENTHTQNSPPGDVPTWDPFLSWTASDRPEIERGLIWYIASSIFVLFCLLQSIWTGAWSFTLVLIVGVAVYIYTHKEKPKEHTIKISGKGFSFDDKKIRWAECTGYWILSFDSHKQLHIERKAGLKREFVILLGNNSEDEISHFINQFIPELTDRNERLLDTLYRICKL